MTKELGTLTDTCVHLTFTPQGFPEDLLSIFGTFQGKKLIKIGAKEK